MVPRNSRRDRRSPDMLRDGRQTGDVCLLVVLSRIVPEWPLIVAANRDEQYARPADPVMVLRERPRTLGGRDRHAGDAVAAFPASARPGEFNPCWALAADRSALFYLDLTRADALVAVELEP